MKAKVPKIASKSIQIELIPFTFLAADAIASLSLSLSTLQDAFLFVFYILPLTWYTRGGVSLVKSSGESEEGELTWLCAGE